MDLIAIYLALVFFVGLISRRLEHSIVTGPMVFTSAGMIIALAVPSVWATEKDTMLFFLLSKVALAVLLFKEGSSIQVRHLRATAPIPARMLSMGMPLIIVLGTIVALALLTNLSIWEAAILGTILSPTDAGLGSAVVNSRLVPGRIREALSIEAGLNDGIAVPLLMLFIALANVNQPLQDTSWLTYFLSEVGFGILIGLGFGLLGGWLIGMASHRGWIAEAFEQLVLLALAILAWYFAEMVGGNGFISAFVAGLFVKIGYEETKENMTAFSESWGKLLNLAVFFIFGILSVRFLPNLITIGFAYAILSLTIVRMVPIAISLLNSGLDRSSVLFVGWFGPRGLASIVLGLIFLAEEVDLPGENTIIAAVVVTVFLSVFLHGFSAAPGIRLYSNKIKDLPPHAPELGDTHRIQGP